MRRALRWSALLLIVAAATSSCTGSDEAEPTAALPPGVIAQVADTPISAELVREIVGATGREAESVVRDLVRGELFTSYVGAEEPSLLRVAERAAYARALLDAMRADALRSGGPITAREVDELTRARWVELSRPRSVRTAHAVALPRAPEHRDAARALAERMKDAVEGIVDPNEFADRVRAVDEEHGSPTAVEVRVEALPPVAEDGRTVPVDVLDEGAPPQLVPEYARAANDLQTPGAQSPVVETDYGFHVLLALEIVPEVRVAPADLRGLVHDEALSLRARPERTRLVEELREKTPIEVARNAMELTRLVGEAR